ncbi:hypothetical protein DFH29DRAFT_801414, partial [Suillus ampliporus]
CQHCNTHFDSTIPFTYVCGKDRSGRVCCPSCAKHYERHKATEQAPDSLRMGESILDFTAAVDRRPSQHELVKATSAAQRGEDGFPSQRFGLSSFQVGWGHAASGQGQMLPPPVPLHASGSGSRLGVTSIGYTPNYAVHQLHHNKMALAASSGHKHQVMIHVALHHLKPEGKSGMMLVGMHKSPRMILYDPRQPCHDSDKAVLQEFFLQSTTKGPIPKFYANACVSILLVMSNAQFEEVLLWQEQQENVALCNFDMDQALPGTTSSIPQKMKKMREVLSSTSDDSTHPPHKCSRMVYNESDAMDTQQSPSATSVVINSEVDSQIGHMKSLQPMFLSKISLQLPTQSQLKAVMEAQGNIQKQASSISMHSRTGYALAVFRLYDIPSISFKELISTPFNIADSQYIVTTLAIDTSPHAMIGLAGTFKSCHPALICSTSTSTSTTPQPAILLVEEVVTKCVFFWKGQGKGRQCFAREDELAMTLNEANCLYWDAALMGMTYTFIDEMLKTGKVPKDIEDLVPHLRLVHAALAVPVDTNNSDVSANYLVEEKISGKFLKYINNNSAVLVHGLHAKEANIALFLFFMQHIQYHLSNHMVCISLRFPGMDYLTDMSCSDFVNSFGDGNCTTGFKNFKSEHQCQQFCRSFGLQTFISASL